MDRRGLLRGLALFAAAAGVAGFARDADAMTTMAPVPVQEPVAPLEPAVATDADVAEAKLDTVQYYYRRRRRVFYRRRYYRPFYRRRFRRCVVVRRRGYLVRRCY